MIMHREPTKHPTPEQLKNARYFSEIVGSDFTEGMHDVTKTILAQMGGINLMACGVKKPYAVVGKHNEGGLLIELDQNIARDRGTFFIISYDYGQDLYTINYFRTVSNNPKAFDLLYESEGIFCDMLSEVFTSKTGIEIPPVEFGPAANVDPEQ